MQTAEYRHLAKREKKYLANPEGRKHLKAAVTMHGRACSDPESRDSDLFKERQGICKRLRRGKPC